MILEQEYEQVAIVSAATTLVPLYNEQLLESLLIFITSTPPKSGVPMIPISGNVLLSLIMVQAKN